MLKVFTYSLDQAWPKDKPKPGAILRLDDQVQSVPHPDEADFVIVPVPIYDYELHGVKPRDILPHLKGNEEKHVWMEIADCYHHHTDAVGNGVEAVRGNGRKAQRLRQIGPIYRKRRPRQRRRP